MCVFENLHVSKKTRSYGFEDVWISWVGDDHGWDSEKFTNGGTKFDVVSVKGVNIRFGKDSVVLELGSSDCWAVAWDEDELGLSASQGLDGVLVS